MNSLIEMEKIIRERTILEDYADEDPRIITSSIDKSVIFYTEGDKNPYKLNVVRGTKHIAPMYQEMIILTSQITDIHPNKGYMYDFTGTIFKYTNTISPLDNAYEAGMYDLIERFDGWIRTKVCPTMKRNYMSNYFPIAMDNIYGYAFMLSGIYYADNQNNEEGTIGGTFKGEIFKDMIWKTIDMNREIRDGKAANNLSHFYRSKIDEYYMMQTFERIQESINETNKKKENYRY